MAVNYYSIQKPVISEIDIKKSRFITYLYPIKTEEDFNDHLATIRKEHYKATHHCQAYILGDDSMIQRMSDDGEPSGTAGVPMLEVLKQNQLTYIMAVTVRYFGGIKLGAGGLVRAYSQAVADAIKQAQIIKNIDQHLVLLELEYKQHDSFIYFLEQSDLPITILDTEFSNRVIYHLAIDSDSYESSHNAIIEFLNGKGTWLELDIQTIDIPVKT